MLLVRYQPRSIIHSYLMPTIRMAEEENSDSRPFDILLQNFPKMRQGIQIPLQIAISGSTQSVTYALNRAGHTIFLLDPAPQFLGAASSKQIRGGVVYMLSKPLG